MSAANRWYWTVSGDAVPTTKTTSIDGLSEATGNRGVSSAVVPSALATRLKPSIRCSFRMGRALVKSHERRLKPIPIEWRTCDAAMLFQNWASTEWHNRMVAVFQARHGSRLGNRTVHDPTWARQPTRAVSASALMQGLAISPSPKWSGARTNKGFILRSRVGQCRR